MRNAQEYLIKGVEQILLNQHLSPKFSAYVAFYVPSLAQKAYEETSQMFDTYQEAYFSKMSADDFVNRKFQMCL